jgi:hypothetical protein
MHMLGITSKTLLYYSMEAQNASNIKEVFELGNNT